MGVCTYLVAQILFRQPFLALLQSIDSYRILITTNRVAHIAILAVTAAIAEEIGRYIAFRFFVKGQSAQNTPLYFGLGHGGIEALSVGVNSVILLVCSPYTLINMGSDVALAGIERISTLLAQIAFSYIVFWLSNLYYMNKSCKDKIEDYRYDTLFDWKKIFIIATAFTVLIILLTFTYYTIWLRIIFVGIIGIIALLNRNKIIEYFKLIKG